MTYQGVLRLIFCATTCIKKEITEGRGRQILGVESWLNSDTWSPKKKVNKENELHMTH